VPISPEEFQDPAWYHARGRVTVWENKAGAAQRHADCKQPWEGGKGDLCAYIREQEQLGDFPGGLKDLATELPEVRKGLVRVFQRWIEVADFDGFRIDTLKHVEHEFWRTFCPAMREHAKSLGKQRFFMFGEAFSGYDELLGSYTAPGEVDSVFYFSQMYRLRDVFNRGQATSNLAQLHQDRLKHYSAQPHPDGVGVPPRDALVNFLDNHDVSRFLSEGTPESLRVALTYLTTTVGLPSIYYGTEQELAGGNDPGNREVMWRGNPDRQLAPYDRSNPTFRHLKALLALRKEHAPLRRGDFTVRWSTTATGAEPDAGIFAYERRHENESVLVVLNAAKCAPGRTHSRTVGGQGQLMQSSFKPGTALANVLSDDDAGDSFVVGPAGVEVKVPCQGAKILVAK
jgi:glycosidase